MNKIIFVTENQFNGKKSLGIGTMDDIRRINTSFYMTTGENLQFVKCLREVDENKLWKMYFFLKYTLEFDGCITDYNGYNKTFTINDREWKMSVEDFTVEVMRNIQWFDTIEDVTSQVNETDWSKKDEAILVVETSTSEDSSNELEVLSV